MNSIRRGRRRPRVKSISFHTLWWVLTREAYTRAVFGPFRDDLANEDFRSAIARRPTSAVIKAAARFFETQPARRLAP